MITCVVKQFHELTPDELYRIIQLRIDNFIVKNKNAYQDLHAYYDKDGYHLMFYSTKLGHHPENMVGCSHVCGKQVFYDEEGKEYKYPTYRRQVWLEGYRDYELEMKIVDELAEKICGEKMWMAELFDEKWFKYYTEKTFHPHGYRYINKVEDEDWGSVWQIIKT